MNLAFEQSIKKWLQNIATDRSLTPAAVWHNVVAERFLVRLCSSPYRSHFVLKGGTLLSKLLRLGRETQDLDFSVRRLSNEVSLLQNVLSQIIALDLEDGFNFVNPVVTPLDHQHMQYLGAQARIDVLFGKAHFPLFIDLGFGDVVAPPDTKILLLGNSKGPLYESFLSIPSYPLEFVFAEKIETLIYRGSENSRMKDYHDLLVMIGTEQILDGVETERACRAVFGHRQTRLALPIRFDALQLERLQKYWGHYRRTLAGPEQFPDHVEHVIQKINGWLESATSFK
jgi:predicted nucleotidyltransferase component of viral defense system